MFSFQPIRREVHFCVFSHPYVRLHIFLRWVRFPCFNAFRNVRNFSRPSQRLHVFCCWATFTCFLALSIISMFSCISHRFHIICASRQLHILLGILVNSLGHSLLLRFKKWRWGVGDEMLGFGVGCYRWV